jgi:membrane protease YdiL (CAAX protease family)
MPRLNAILEILLCSSVPTQVVIGAILGIMGLTPIGTDGTLSLTFIVALSLVDTVVLIALMVALTRVHGERVADLWLGRRRVSAEAGLGLLLIPVVFGLVVVLLSGLRVLAPWLHNVPSNPLEELAGTPARAALFAVVAIFAGGVREELQRAFLLQRFERHLGGATVGVVVLSAAFGLGHVVQGWDAMITTGMLGAFWAVLYLRRRSAVAPIVSHAGFNSVEVLRVVITGGP